MLDGLFDSLVYCSTNATQYMNLQVLKHHGLIQALIPCKPHMPPCTPARRRHTLLTSLCYKVAGKQLDCKRAHASGRCCIA